MKSKLIGAFFYLALPVILLSSRGLALDRGVAFSITFC
jgi:hypothetical protein